MRGRDISLPRGLSGRRGDRTGGWNCAPPRRSLAVRSRVSPPGGGSLLLLVAFLLVFALASRSSSRLLAVRRQALRGLQSSELLLQPLD